VRNCLEDLDSAQHGKAIDLKALEARGNIIEEAKNDAEREVIKKVLDKFESNKTQAARYLGIARPLLYQKMKRLDIKE